MKPETRNTIISIVLTLGMCYALLYFNNISLEMWVATLKDVIHGGVH